MNKPGSPHSLAAWLARCLRLVWFLSLVSLPLIFVAVSLLALSSIAGDGAGILPRIFVNIDMDAPGTRLEVLTGESTTARLLADRGSLYYEPGRPAGAAMLIFWMAGAMALWLLILHRLKSITGALCDGQPFVAENARRLRTVGLAVCGLWLVDLTMQFLSQRLAASQFALVEGSFPWFGELNLQTLFMGLLVLVISQVFRIGTMLQEDHDATI